MGSKLISLLVPEDMIDKLKILSKKKMISVSALIRIILQQYIDQNCEKQNS